MFARKIVPILLVAGAVHIMMHHSQRGCEEQPAGLPGDGVARGPQFGHGPFGHHSPFGMRGAQSAGTNRVPPMFEMLHNRAHAAQTAAQQPPASTPAI